ncbi:hypothetical protein LguiB_026889 [Lonicera macranthoides]
MELLASPASANAACCFISSGPPASSPLLFFRRRNSTSPFSLKFKDSHLPFNAIRLRGTYTAAAVVSDRGAVPNESVKENRPFAEQSEPAENQEAPTEEESEEKEDHKMVRVCDKLIGIFMIDKPTPTDWRRLLAFSKSWNDIRPHFYKRCQDRADSEDDPGMKHKLLRLRRKLKEIDDDVQRHNELFTMVKRASSDIREIVARRRKDFTKEFFDHIFTVAQSYLDNPDEKDDVVKIGKMCLDAVQAYDIASDSVERMNAAQLKLDDIMNSPSLDAAHRKIDFLAKNNQLDSALALTATKAWSAGKESSMMKDEAKDMLYHLYLKARGNLQRQLPKEIRIIKYVLTIKDPEERLSALKDAFTPGVEVEGEDVDVLYTTPEIMHDMIQTVVVAYHSSKEGTVLRQARDLLNPNIVRELEVIQKLIRDNFM